jgi:membrane-associated protein
VESRVEYLDWLIHIDEKLESISAAMGVWMYALLFLVIFCETGLVVTPFLPGDSLLFAVGAIIALPESGLNLVVMLVVLIAAAIIGDAVNYWIGRTVGPRVFNSESSWLLNKNHLLRAQAFYEKHGGKAIVLARFVPILRTFAPFVAGIGRMNYVRFWIYNAGGGAAWVTLFVLAGWFFGNFPVVKRNFELVILVIIVLSVVPIAIEWYRGRKQGLMSSLGESGNPPLT